MHIPTFLIFDVQQKRGVENARKRHPNYCEIVSNSKILIRVVVAPERPGLRFALMEIPCKPAGP